MKKKQDIFLGAGNNLNIQTSQLKMVAILELNIY